MYRRAYLIEIEDCKVLPKDRVASHHRLLKMDVSEKTKKRKEKNQRKKKRIQWTVLDEKAKRKEFKTNVLDRVNVREHKTDVETAEILRSNLGSTRRNI